MGKDAPLVPVVTACHPPHWHCKFESHSLDHRSLMIPRCRAMQGRRLVFLCLVGLVGCASTDPTFQPMNVYTNEAEMKSEVLRYVGTGMPIDQAKEAMEKHGFTCSFG